MEYNEMIPSNLKGEKYMIRKCQANYYHILMERDDINPNNPLIRNRKERIVVMTKEEFELNESRANSKQPFSWVTVSGWHTATLIHNSELISDELKKECENYWFEVRNPKRNNDNTKNLQQQIDTLKKDIKRRVKKQIVL